MLIIYCSTNKTLDFIKENKNVLIGFGFTLATIIIVFLVWPKNKEKKAKKPSGSSSGTTSGSTTNTSNIKNDQTPVVDVPVVDVPVVNVPVVNVPINDDSQDSTSVVDIPVVNTPPIDSIISPVNPIAPSKPLVNPTPVAPLKPPVNPTPEQPPVKQNPPKIPVFNQNNTPDIEFIKKSIKMIKDVIPELTQTSNQPVSVDQRKNNTQKIISKLNISELKDNKFIDFLSTLDNHKILGKDGFAIASNDKFSNKDIDKGKIILKIIEDNNLMRSPDFNKILKTILEAGDHNRKGIDILSKFRIINKNINYIEFDQHFSVDFLLTFLFNNLCDSNDKTNLFDSNDTTSISNNEFNLFSNILNNLYRKNILFNISMDQVKKILSSHINQQNKETFIINHFIKPYRNKDIKKCFDLIEYIVKEYYLINETLIQRCMSEIIESVNESNLKDYIDFINLIKKSQIIELKFFDVYLDSKDKQEKQILENIQKYHILIIQELINKIVDLEIQSNSANYLELLRTLFMIDFDKKDKDDQYNKLKETSTLGSKYYNILNQAENTVKIHEISALSNEMVKRIEIEYDKDSSYNNGKLIGKEKLYQKVINLCNIFPDILDIVINITKDPSSPLQDQIQIVNNILKNLILNDQTDRIGIDYLSTKLKDFYKSLKDFYKSSNLINDTNKLSELLKVLIYINDNSQEELNEYNKDTHYTTKSLTIFDHFFNKSNIEDILNNINSIDKDKLNRKIINLFTQALLKGDAGSFTLAPSMSFYFKFYEIFYENNVGKYTYNKELIDRFYSIIFNITNCNRITFYEKLIIWLEENKKNLEDTEDKKMVHYMQLIEYLNTEIQKLTNPKSPK